jgi:hypothetical protein
VPNINKTQVKANITITFAIACDDDKSISVELDADLNGDSSCFLYGLVPAYVRVYTNPIGLEYDYWTSYADASFWLHNASGVESNKEEILEFIEEATASLEKPTTALKTVVWFGNDLSPITLSGAQKVTVATKSTGTPPDDFFLGTCKVTYDAPYKVYGLTVPSNDITRAQDEWPIIVFLKQKKTV